MSQTGKGKGAAPKAKASTPAKAPAGPKGGVTKRKADKKHIKDLPIFEKRPRNFGIGGDIQPKRDLTRFVKWPKYVRLQRQKSILLKRLKVPGTINQFSRAIDKNTAQTLFTFLHKYRPETRKAKHDRLLAAAKAEVKAEKGAKAPASGSKPRVVKFGLNHVTSLIESKKASLVLIAHDVDPLELVLWLPTLCRKKDVPFLIVKGKARLGKVVHKKNASVLAITSVNDADKKTLDNLIQKGRDNYLGRYQENIKATGGQIMGPKHNAQKAKEHRARLAEVKQK